VRLRLAKKLEPRLHVADVEMARAFALLGDFDMCEELLKRAESALQQLEYACMMQRVRFLAGWRRDRECAQRLMDELKTRPDLMSMPGMRSQLETHIHGRLTPEARRSLENAAHATIGVPRRQSFAYQRLTELCVAAGDIEGAHAAMAQAD